MPLKAMSHGNESAQRAASAITLEATTEAASRLETGADVSVPPGLDGLRPQAI
jgi:hypothetical protein